MARKKKSKKKSAPRKKKGAKAEESSRPSDSPPTEELTDELQAEPERPVEEVPLQDLDAVLDEDLDGSEDLDALIAATVEGATDEDQVEEVPVVALDEGAPPPSNDEPHVLDDELPVEAAEEEEEEEEDVGRPDEEPLPSPEEYLEGAIDLGEESSPEVRDRLLAQALAHAEMQEARYRVPYSGGSSASRWKGAAAAVLLLAASVIAVAPPSWVRPAPPAQLTLEQRTLSVRRALLLQAEQVDAHRVRNQQLPRTLDELGQSFPGIRYVRSGNRAYQLIAYGPDGESIVFDSGNVTREFRDVATTWSRGTPE